MFETLSLLIDKPNTTVKLQDKTPMANAPFTLTCEADGQPPVDKTGPYEWQKNRNIIGNQNKRTYTIPRLVPMVHDGNYTCSADNFLGNGGHGKAATLRIYCKFIDI